MKKSGVIGHQKKKKCKTRQENLAQKEPENVPQISCCSRGAGEMKSEAWL